MPRRSSMTFKRSEVREAEIHCMQREPCEEESGDVACCNSKVLPHIFTVSRCELQQLNA